MYEKVVKDTNGEIMPPELENLQKEPYIFRNAFDMFWKIRRQTSLSEPVSLSAVSDYQNLYGVKMSPFELDAVWAIDRAFTTAIQKEKTAT